MLEEGWGEIVMTLFFVFFQHPLPPSFVRPNNQITLEMGGTFWFGFGVVIWCALGRESVCTGLFSSWPKA